MSEDLKPGQAHFDWDEAVKTTFEEHGSRCLSPGAPVITWKTPTVRLRRDVGRVMARRDLDTKPGYRMVLAMARQIESVGDVQMSELKSDHDLVRAVRVQQFDGGESDITLADFIYLMTWRAWERYGAAWQYPHAFNCVGCDALIQGAEIDISSLSVFRPSRGDASVTYRLRYPWRRSADELVTRVVIGRSKLGFSFIDASKTEFDETDDVAIRVREVASSIRSMTVVDADGNEKDVETRIISHQSLGEMHEFDFESLSRFVADLRINGGTGRVLSWLHDKETGGCGAESNLALSWRTDFLASSGG